MADNSMTSQGSVVIERILDAPVDLVWSMWTDPEHFKAWYGPDGAVVPEAKMDVRVGGSRLICMEVTTPGGPMRMWFAGEYLDVVERRRLVYTDSVSDEQGNVESASGEGAGAHPTTEVHVELEDLNGRTKMTMTHVGIPAGSPGASAWEGAFNKLDSYLEAGEAGSNTTS
jgi:uncharacterized protein YndB with AHSA1/START domain